MIDIRVASINSFFDGVSVNDLSTADWMLLHTRVFMGNYAMLDRLRAANREVHPVEDVLNQYRPDIVIVNEVIQSELQSKALKILKKRGYHNPNLDALQEVNSKHRRGTLVVCNRSCVKLDVEIQRFPGGRFAAMRIPEWHLVVIGVQGTPFNNFIRKKQISTVLDYFESFREEGARVLVAGDFNMGVNSSSLSLPPGVGHFTRKSFPGPDFFELIRSENSWSSRLLSVLLNLEKGPRNLDHVFYSSNLKHTSGEAVSTISDHCALVSTFQF